MKKLFFNLSLLFVTTAIFAQTKTITTTTPAKARSFVTVYFIKNMDSLRRERLLLDSLLKVSSRMLDTAYTKIDRFNAVIRWYNANGNNRHRVDSINAIIAKFESETKKFNQLNEQIDKQVSFFNELLPRITKRLQKFADDNSTKTSQIQIDWNDYIEVHHEFANWGNHMIQEYNLNVSNLHTINAQINGAINSFNRHG